MSLLGWLFRAADLEHYKQGIAHFNAGEYEQAAQALEQALACSGSEHSAHHHLERFYAAEAHARLGEVFLAQGKIDCAAAELRQAIELGQNYPDRLTMLARIWHMRGQPREALELLERALSLNPSYRAAQAVRVLCLDELGEQAVVREAVQELAAADPALAAAIKESHGLVGGRRSAEGLGATVRNRLLAILEERGEPKRRVRLADSYEMQGDRGRALVELESLAREYPDYPDVRLRLGTVLHRCARYAEARSHIEHALQVNPRYAEAHLQMGVLRLKEGRAEEALEHLARAAHYEPGHPGLPLLQALALLRCGRWREAEQLLERNATAPRERAEALRGLIAWVAGDEEGARAKLASALAASPGLDWAADAYAQLVSEQGAHDEARRVLECALNLQPANAALRLSLARAHHREGRWTESFAAVEAVLAREPRQAVALVWKGRLLAERGSYAEAERLLRQVVSQDQTASLGWRDLGRVQLRQGKPADASQALATSVARTAHRPDAALDLALSYYRQALLAQAHQALEQVDPEDADHPLIRLLLSPTVVDDL